MTLYKVNFFDDGGRIYPQSPNYDFAARLSDARCLVLSDFSWPQAAIISRPLETLTGEEYPASLTIFAKRWIALLLEHI